MGGDASKLYRGSATTCWSRALMRANPFYWWHHQMVHPRYTGPFAQTQDQYWFETAWTFYRMTVPVVSMMTYYRDLRYLLETFLGFVVLAVLLWRSPVQGCLFAAFLRILAFCLSAIPFYAYLCR